MAIVSGSLGGFWVSKDSLAHPIGDLGFAILATVWLVTASLAYWTIRHRKVAQHRQWIALNYSLTYAAVMLRWQLPLLMVAGLSDSAALTITAYSSWIPNVLFAIWWLSRQSAVRTA